jgi:hypothetical protein
MTLYSSAVRRAQKEDIVTHHKWLSYRVRQFASNSDTNHEITYFRAVDDTVLVVYFDDDGKNNVILQFFCQFVNVEIRIEKKFLFQTQKLNQYISKKVFQFFFFLRIMVSYLR